MNSPIIFSCVVCTLILVFSVEILASIPQYSCLLQGSLFDRMVGSGSLAAKIFCLWRWKSVWPHICQNKLLFNGYTV